MRYSFLLVMVVVMAAGCGQLPSAPEAPAERGASSVLGDPVRPPCDTTGGTTCHGTLPWY